MFGIYIHYPFFVMIRNHLGSSKMFASFLEGFLYRIETPYKHESFPGLMKSQYCLSGTGANSE